MTPRTDKRMRVASGVVVLLAICGSYIYLGLSIGASVSEMIPSWRIIASLIVIAIAGFIGIRLAPASRRTTASFMWLMAILSVRILVDPLSRWFFPLLAISTLIIACVAAFWPARNTGIHSNSSTSPRVR